MVMISNHSSSVDWDFLYLSIDLLIFSPPLQGNVAQCIQDPNFDSEDPSSPGEGVQFKSITNIKRTDIELL